MRVWRDRDRASPACVIDPVFADGLDPAAPMPGGDR
jgi:hypothetical protein